MSDSNEQQKAEQNKQFSIQKLYVKDASFESPGAPHSFRFKKWDPKIDLNLTNSQSHVDGDIYETVLCVTATVKLEDKTTFLVEVHYAGLFALVGFEEEERHYLLGSQCMNILFPYAREVVSDLTTRGGFPPLTLSPVNFDALYQKHMRAEAEQPDAEADTAEAGPATH
jgi:preprotein translocase subunit SecB